MLLVRQMLLVRLCRGMSHHPHVSTELTVSTARTPVGQSELMGPGRINDSQAAKHFPEKVNTAQNTKLQKLLAPTT